MKERVITGLALVLIFGLALLSNDLVLLILVSAVILLAAYEIYDLKKKELRPIMLILIGVMTITGGLMQPAYFPVFVMIFIMLLFSLTVFFEWFHFEHVSYIFVMVMLLVMAIQSVQIVLSINRITFFYVLLATYTTDTFAFFGGKFFGKHKLIERISPKKTVEGAISGFVVSAIVSITFGYFFVQQYIGLPVIIVSSLLIPIVGQFGDLAFSLVKRYFDVKDFGSIFPGHGGVLDRIDSLIFALFAFTCVLTLIG